ncbi:hypothetical protein B0T11DRAFT_277958 [Plectosphaerella cucumerina]|uniref:Uncharacterized protein n=1 Tax=Plectosphaerella cucumerina TaxID=40658 RepID=A0A8K0TSZ7_9PEZI|nr:hypothetical protein B0T11DRAFT_277958 [Plectosphaerella cucumerina]
MENDAPSEEGRVSRRGRLMGKLFGGKEKEAKPTQSSNDAVNDFLHASASVHPTIAPPSPGLPVLTKLDTRTAPRYPGALDVGSQQSIPLRPRTSSPGSRIPRKNRKGYTVRFTDTPPEIIGEGGDETALPTIEISKRKRMRPPPSPRPSLPPSEHDRSPDPPRRNDDFAPGPIKRTQTGFTSISSPAVHSPGPPPPRPAKEEIIPGTPARTRFLDTQNSRAKDDNRRSFLEIHQAEMRQAEGRAFAEAARKEGQNSNSTTPHEDTRAPVQDPFEQSPELHHIRPMSPQTQMNTQANRPQQPTEESPTSVYSSNTTTSGGFNQQQQNNGNFSRQPSNASQQNPYTLPTPMSAMTAGPFASRQQSVRMQDAMSPSGDDALLAFVSRTRHLSELFRLHAETVKPVSACDPPELIRAALWWFLKGRMGLEAAVRARPSSPQDQMHNEMDRQQAYTNLSKARWISEEAVPEITGNRQLPDVDEARQAIVYNLRKLCVSMKRNGFLPPEEPFLPQTLDKSIWIEYPKLSQDMIALLTGNSAAAMTGEARQATSAEALDALPLSDTAEVFSFGRVPVDAFLMEQGNDNHTVHFKCLLSMVRSQKAASPVFVVATQNSHVHLRISGNKKEGPTWEQVRWNNDTCALEVGLPRGFKVAIQCSQSDYRMLWSMYDFGSKTQATLYPRSDENCVFRATLRNFQFFDSEPQSRAFPKEPVPACDVALFEKVLKEKTATGPRTWHRGFRLAVVSGPRTRSLSGLNPTWSPQQSIPFGFLRGDGGDPALLLKCDSGRQKGTMVLSFNDETERLRFHTLLTGTAVLQDETIYADVPLTGFSMARTLDDSVGLPGISKLPWQMVRIINDDNGDDSIPPTVLSDKLKIVIDSKIGTIADRVNVETGELRVRLDVEDAKTMSILRRPQHDMTISVSDAQAGKETPKDVTESLQMLQTMQSIRTFKFPSLKDLHAFQAALTGFTVKFDGLASTFAIARRRMVVPIHKKWEAGWTRIQVLQQDKVIQLLAFFPDFAHGQCMNFVLKGTDVYETLSRSSKYGIRFVDAKFPMPRMPQEGDANADDGGFVCLDFPDLPGEHDDITLTFENETERDRLAQCLPAPVKGGSRLASKINF